eukprot:gb/GECH01009603.1/.p1 GENE.gb/GECH01009603.1/~~gb/GECH01009603.1/.p1  ORF type:complete len:323 (+),score=83.28 gb/GECH01009603.1/:1-969(+)
MDKKLNFYGNSLLKSSSISNYSHIPYVIELAVKDKIREIKHQDSAFRNYQRLTFGVSEENDDETSKSTSKSKNKRNNNAQDSSKANKLDTENEQEQEDIKLDKNSDSIVLEEFIERRNEFDLLSPTEFYRETELIKMHKFLKENLSSYATECILSNAVDPQRDLPSFTQGMICTQLYDLEAFPGANAPSEDVSTVFQEEPVISLFYMLCWRNNNGNKNADIPLPLLGMTTLNSQHVAELYDRARKLRIRFQDEFDTVSDIDRMEFFNDLSQLLTKNESSQDSQMIQDFGMEEIGIIEDMLNTRSGVWRENRKLCDWLLDRLT